MNRPGVYITVIRDVIPLTAGHVPAACRLSSLAGWNQTEDDWRLLIELSNTCFGIEVDGTLVSTATLLCYGQTLAWVGMVLTHPEFRRRGLARRLMEKVMQEASARGIATVKLDATGQGQPLYADFGFQPEQPVERWQGSKLRGGGKLATAVLPNTLDAISCGYDRRALLERLAKNGRATAYSRGYVLDRPGRLKRYLGPCVAEDADSAALLLEQALSCEHEDGWFWDLLPANGKALKLAQRFGFERTRSLTRMTWGADLHGKPDQVFAIGGFEFG